MAAFNFVVERLADIMQKPRAAGDCSVKAEFVGHHLCQECHFNAVPQHILPIAGSIIQRTQQSDDLIVKSANINFDRGGLADLQYLIIDFFFDLFNQVLQCVPDGFGRPE